MTNTEIQSDTSAEEQDYLDWRNELLSKPENRAIYEEEVAKAELWLQLVEARQEAGLTQAQMAERMGVSQAQVARIEKRGYDAYTLNTLRRYIKALGEGYSLEIKISTPAEKSAADTAPDAGSPTSDQQSAAD